MNEQLKDIGIRAFKTFVQGFVAYALLNFASVQDVNTAKAFVLGAVAAGISALWNIFNAANQARKNG